MTKEELQEISQLLDDLPTKSERRSKLFELKRKGINIHDVACAFLMGSSEVRNEAMGFYILKSFIKTDASEAEQIYCLLKGKGIRKNSPKAHWQLESFLDNHSGAKDLVLFDSPFSDSFTLSSILDDKDWKKVDDKIQFVREKNAKRERKLRKFRFPIIFFFEIVPILIFLSYPLWAVFLWPTSLGNKISVVCLSIIFLFNLGAIISHFKGTYNDAGLTLIETLGNLNKNIEKIAKGKQKPNDIPYGFWVITICLAIPVVFCFLPILKYVSCWLLPSLTIIVIVLYWVYSAVGSVQQEIYKIRQRDPNFVEDVEYGRGIGVGSAFILVMSFAAGIIVAVLWGLYFASHFNTFF